MIILGSIPKPYLLQQAGHIPKNTVLTTELQQRNYTMSDLNNNNTKFNLPSYINIPLFLYQDSRLEKSALLIASFFYSLHTAGQSITASKDYLCQLAGVCKSQYFCILNQLEEIGYIKRTGFTNRKKTQWVYSPKSELIVDETDTSPAPRTNVKSLNTSPVHRTKLVRPTGLNLSGSPDIDIKEDTKDNKKLTTVDQAPSSSSFFSQEQKDELLSYKLQCDDRTDELFLEHCTHHVKKQEQENDFSNYQRFTGLKHILTNQYETKEKFKATGFGKESLKVVERTTPPTKEDFDNYKTCVPGYEWVGLWRSKNAG